MSDRNRRSRSALPLLLAVPAIAGFAWLMVRAQAAPQGPVPIVWDKEACAFCHMHVGEPALASQVQLQDGRVLVFDDPGCLMSWLEQSKEAPRAVYLRHHREDRWLSKEQAAFAAVGATPMGFGLGAVDKGAPGSLSWEQAQEKVKSTHAQMGGM